MATRVQLVNALLRMGVVECAVKDAGVGSGSVVTAART